MERPWLKWESDLGASRGEIIVPPNFEAKSGTVVEDGEKASYGILLDDAAPVFEAGEAPRKVEIIRQDAAVDLSLLIFEESTTEDLRQELVAELARNRVLDRK